MKEARSASSSSLSSLLPFFLAPAGTLTQEEKATASLQSKSTPPPQTNADHLLNLAKQHNNATPLFPFSHNRAPPRSQTANNHLLLPLRSKPSSPISRSIPQTRASKPNSASCFFLTAPPALLLYLPPNPLRGRRDPTELVSPPLLYRPRCSPPVSLSRTRPSL